ncbi:GAF and ANTAR domain-containing protein [Pseudarthrobacter defluvii]|uniref:GAF and ANTAR domain-containing protein n=1 Tax=Pseudarthrobacter defluvii TaxID=410837 RepID=UPI0027D82512|nr:GAF and ANTAR domain-containing protein [Pseudarthrobacter defluvii]
MTAVDHSRDFELLHALVIGTENVKGFLDGTTGLAAAMMTQATGDRIECAVMVHPRRRGAIISGSSEDAVLFEGTGQGRGGGPRATALQTRTIVVVRDVCSEPGWRQYCEAITDLGCCSVLAVPLDLGSGGEAVLDFFAPETALFTAEVIEDVQAFAGIAGQALRVELRIMFAELLTGNLKAALESRTTIDLACGMIMALNRCSQNEAFDILRRASIARNQKLHSLAQEIISNVSGAEEITTHFDA